MIKTTRYCDICGREIDKNFDKYYYELTLPYTDGVNIMGTIKSDVCSECTMKLHWKIKEIKYPNRKCPD